LVELDKNEFRRRFPNLCREIEHGISDLTSEEAGEVDKFKDYAPTVIDYLRRCDTNEQAENTISYLLEKGEITTDCAEDLRKQLNEKGLRSFGTRKKDGFYLKEAGLA
jgi:hypothetical protein